MKSHLIAPFAVITLLPLSLSTSAQGPPAAASRPEPSLAIKDVVTRVAQHQLRELEDGDYTRGTWDEVLGEPAAPSNHLDLSEGTGIGETIEFYRDRKRPVNDHHGPGPVMFAGAELLEIAREEAQAVTAPKVKKK